MTDSKKSPKKRLLFTEHQMRQLEGKLHVLHVSEKSKSYSPAFKLAALESYQHGKTSQEIFMEAGFQLDVIGNRKPNECLKRWRSAQCFTR